MQVANRSGVTTPERVDLMTHVSIEITEPGEHDVVFAIAGEIDMATAPLLAHALGWYRECDVVVDLSAVRFLGSSGLAVLIHAYKELLHRGHTLRTTGESGIVLAAMSIAGLDDTFHGGPVDDSAAQRGPQ